LPQLLFAVEGATIKPCCKTAETGAIVLLNLKVEGEEAAMVLQN
jgi:hypothetical protein